MENKEIKKIKEKLRKKYGYSTKYSKGFTVSLIRQSLDPETKKPEGYIQIEIAFNSYKNDFVVKICSYFLDSTVAMQANLPFEELELIYKLANELRKEWGE